MIMEVWNFFFVCREAELCFSVLSCPFPNIFNLRQVKLFAGFADGAVMCDLKITNKT
jgi:hypothetical protein